MEYRKFQNDIFPKYPKRHVTTTCINRWETRKFRLSATYNFGKRKKKEVKAVDLDDELGRYNTLEKLDHYLS